MRAYDSLTPKQRAFVDAYLASGNATQAYTDAGYAGRGSTARVNASRMLTNANMLAALAERRAQLATANDVTPERVIQEWARVAFFSLRQAATWTNAGLDLHDSATLSDDVAAAIAEVESAPTEFGTKRKLKAHSKIAALRALSEHLDLFGTRDALEKLGQGLMGLLTTHRNTASNG